MKKDDNAGIINSGDGFKFLLFLLFPIRRHLPKFRGIKMKHFTILLIFTVLLSGCQKEVPASHIAAQNAINTISAMYEGLPQECKTDTSKLLSRVAQNEVVEVENHCKNEKAKIEREKIKWKAGFFGLFLAIVIYVIKKVLK